MSDSITVREASVLVIALAGIGISFGSFSLVGATQLDRVVPYIIGYSSAWFGWFYREITIFQTSFEGKMIRDNRHRGTIRFFRLLRSVLFRTAQISPMFLWTFWLRWSSQETLTVLMAMLLFSIPMFLTWMEEKFLWDIYQDLRW